MKNIIRAYVIICFSFISSVSIADCYHNGKAYKTGDIVGGYVCTADGIWIKN